MKDFKAIEVYLDSSDYSDLSNEKKLAGDKNLREVKEELSALVDQGIINIRFSNITVFEIMHTRIDAKTYALNRARTINELCVGKTLVDANNLISVDALKLANMSAVSNDIFDVFKDDGNWFSHDFIISENYQDIAISKIKEFIDLSTLTQDEKLFHTENLTNKDRLTDTGIEFSLEHKLFGVCSFLDIFPIDIKERFYNKLRSYLQGNITEEVFNQEFFTSVLNVENFVELIIDNPNIDIDKLFLRNVSKKEIKTFDKLKVQLQTMVNPLIEKGFPEKDILKELKKHYLPIFPKVRDALLNKEWDDNKELYTSNNITKETWTENIVNSKIGKLPSFDIYHQLKERYLVDNIFVLMGGRNLKTSDICDLLHARYLPYVDIFSCDAYMSSLIRPLDKTYNTKIITNLEDLIKELKNTLSNRSTGK